MNENRSHTSPGPMKSNRTDDPSNADVTSNVVPVPGPVFVDRSGAILLSDPVKRAGRRGAPFTRWNRFPCAMPFLR